MTRRFAASLLAVPLILFQAAPSFAEVPKFGSTCIASPASRVVKRICVSSNGRTLNSQYVYRDRYDTRGTHTGCRLSGNMISCSGGSYRTKTGESGRMDPFYVRLSNGRPISAGWR